VGQVKSDAARRERVHDRRRPRQRSILAVEPVRWPQATSEQ
jgi:hypothetical protein